MSRGRLQAPYLDAPPLVRYGIPELKIHASPAAATDFSFAIDGNFYTRMVSIFCRLVCDANAANREVVVSYEMADGTRFALAGINTAVTANQTADFAFNVYTPSATVTVDSSALVPLPPMLLLPTQLVKLHIVNVQAGDQLSRIRTVWERFYTTSQPPVDVPGGE